MQPRRPLARTLATLALAGAATAASLSAHAALLARNLDLDTSTTEAYYDSALDITWMRDTSRLASAMGLSTAMSHASADTAIAGFNADATLNYGHSGWRLPGADGVHTIGGAGCQFGFNGSTDCGDNVNVASSELAYMFHVNLGNLSWRDIAGQARPGTANIDFGLVNLDGFHGLDDVGYWSGTTSHRLILGIQQTGQVVFDMHNGTQAVIAPTGLKHAWLVHDGDIGGAVSAAALPLPGTLALAGLALCALGRRRALQSKPALNRR